MPQERDAYTHCIYVLKYRTGPHKYAYLLQANQTFKRSLSDDNAN
jgi:hypothetical protein